MKGLLSVFVVVVGASTIAFGQRTPAAEKPGPPKSGFYSFFDASAEFEIGIGIVQWLSCVTSTLLQPPVYAGNSLLDCDGEVPHNETTIAVDPNDPMHAVGGYHSYQLVVTGATLKAHIIGTTSVTFDGGQSWQEVVPPITPYQFTGDPALAFDSRGRIYFANIADHEGPGGSFTAPNVVVARSDDSGLSWTTPVTVARGQGALNSGANPQLIVQDKEFIAADAHAASPFRDRVYVTWTSFQEVLRRPNPLARSPILLSYSDDGERWTPSREISGFHPSCSVQVGGGPAGQCDENQFSVPTVAPDGAVYVAFENFNTPAENHYLVVSSPDGGATWTSPVRVDTVYDINYPRNLSGRSTLTGCALRVNAAGNLAADPSDPSGNTVYLAWADNRNGSAAATNADVLLARSTDGGATWSTYLLDSTPNDQFYPWVAVAPDGRVDVGYMDRSYSSGQAVCLYGFTLTRVTFDNAGAIATLVRQRVDTGLSDPGRSRWFSAATGGNSLFIGDYNGVATGADGRTWSVWTDQRNLVTNPPSPNRNHGQHAVGAVTP